MFVRKSNTDDLPKIMFLYSFLNENDSTPSKETLDSVWNYINKNQDKYTYFVIEDNNELLATCNISIIPNLTRGARPFAIIENVVTHPDYRRMGLGKKIIETAIDYAKNQNCYKVMLLSNTKRKDAHKFYETIGFNGDEKKGFTIDLK